MMKTRRAILATLVTLAIALPAFGQTPNVYVTEHGTHYHLSRSCLALHNAKPEHVHEITLKEATTRGLDLCGICALRQKKAQKKTSH